MSRTDDRADKTLPVTAEVGDEGGSYADPATQVETFSGPDGNPRVDQARIAGAGAVAAAAEPVADDDVVKHATERPDAG
jgi:hypothetical protein